MHEFECFSSLGKFPSWSNITISVDKARLKKTLKMEFDLTDLCSCSLNLTEHL